MQNEGEKDGGDIGMKSASYCSNTERVYVTMSILK